ncbi:hypothetical protein [Paenibacillus mucilaginosus]|uniref:Uncharacterized protein n=1 Tax=Paenibacillus mucilaginosus (strain KNP414) TaxID=1036673 RepID=F8F6Q4_PAEMK|nr:hypothetical protein [Paenibacillus mucilaginosus]AEI43570.1 hypothetical protein KNP414_05046 [Paenibacillus mucilaginosus KNP414]MCG7211893.1 hypothetical protein [Paenibacillus mucilaginosus]WDM25106.1 hypothetical protein KCX80_21855 [Paenibacillus mucilaginosus]
MLRATADLLFIVSLFILVTRTLIFFVRSGGLSGTMNTGDAGGAATDLQMNHDQNRLTERQHRAMYGLLRSYVLWAAVLGILISVVLGQM